MCIIDLLAAVLDMSDVGIRESDTGLSTSAPENQNFGAKERLSKRAKYDFLNEPAVPLSSVKLTRRYLSHVRLG